MFRFRFRRRRGCGAPQGRDLDNVFVIVGVNGVESAIGWAPPLTDEKLASVKPKTKLSSPVTAVASSDLRALEQQAQHDETVEENVMEKLQQNMSCCDINAIVNAGERYLSDHKPRHVSSLFISEDEDDNTTQSGSELTTEYSSESECSDEVSKYSLVSSKCSNENPDYSGESTKCPNKSENNWGESAAKCKTSLPQSVDEGLLLLTDSKSRSSDPFDGLSWDIHDEAHSSQKKFKLRGLPTASTAESSGHISFAEGPV